MKPARFVAATDAAVTTVPNVELLEVGEDWETSTGIFTFTADDLASAVAAQDDPGIRSAVIKLGHTDPRFDGQPSIGRAENLRTTNEGQTLVGDLVGVPTWLADVMGSAYPRRSIEGWFNATSRTGNTWAFVLTGVALLGSSYPAIDTLEDIEALWGDVAPVLIPVADVPAVVASDAAMLIRATRGGAVPRWKRTPVEAAAPLHDPMTGTHSHSHTAPGTVSGGDATHTHAHTHNGDAAHSTHDHAMMPDLPAAVSAAVSVEDIRRSFYDQATGPMQMWWWIREVRVAPAEIIVDDDEGGLMRIPYSITGDTLTFGDPVPCVIEYVDVKAGRPLVAATAHGQIVAAAWADPGQAGRRTTRPAAAAPAPEEERPMALTPEALAKLGLAADADEAAVEAALLALAPTPAPAVADPAAPVAAPTPLNVGDTATPPVAAPTAGPEPVAPVVPIAPVLPDGLVVIDEATLNELRQGAVAATALMTERTEAQRNAVLDDAVRAGKFPRSRREHYGALLAADPEGTTALIASLAPGVIPIGPERGVVGGDTADVAAASAYPDAWKPSVEATRRKTAGLVKVSGD